MKRSGVTLTLLGFALLLITIFYFPFGHRPKTVRETPPWEESSCQMSQEKTTEDLQELIAEFLRRDLKGTFRQPDAWALKNVVCPGALPQPDTTWVIERVELISITEDLVKIRYNYMAWIDDHGMVFENDQQSVALNVQRTPYGLRLPTLFPTGGPHVSLEVLAKELRSKKELSPNEEEFLRQVGDRKTVVAGIALEP